MAIAMSRTKLAVLKIFMWFHLFGVPALVSTSVDADSQQYQRPTGRVSLFSFERGVLRSVTENVDTEVVLTMPPRYFEAYLFECNASYPVQWAYIGEAAPVITADVGRFFRDFYDVNTYTYQSILLMYSLQELQSGRYICRGASKDHDKLAIHYDVFVPGNGTQILLSTSEKKLFIPENKEHVYIPCGVSDSTAAVNLYRGNQWGTFYPVPVNGSITFNPRKGFKIRFKDFLDPWGTYLCVVASNKKRRKVHLIPESVKAKYDLINHVSGKIPVYFSYEYEYNRVLCCTGTNFLPKLQWAGCASILDCQVKSACFEEDRCEQRFGNSGYNPSKWIDPGPLPPGCSGYRLRDDPNGDFGLFKCSTPGIAQYQPFLLNRGNIFLDFEKTPPSEMILTLQRISPEGPSFVGDEVEFHCNSTRFYFAYGIRWGWEKIGGEIEFVDDSSVIRDKYSIKGHRRRSTLKIPHSNIKSIICFVPVVNSATEWRTVSLPVVIASNELNLISNQIPTPNNVIDLDSLTYHTDYDSANPTPAKPQQVPPILQQTQQRADLQVYNSAKAPRQEFQAIPTTSVEQPNPNPNYYSYAHDASTGYQYQPANTNTHQPQQTLNSHPPPPIQEPQTVDIYSPAIQAQASTPSPTSISISRSKKIRSRTSSVSSTGRMAPIPKPDIHYDPVERDYSDLYDTFEPSPSSSSNTNTRVNTKNPPHHLSPRMRAPTAKASSVTTGSPKRPLSPATIRNFIHRSENLNAKNSKPNKDYNDYTDHDEFGVNLRLSLPFEPTIPIKRKHAHGSNYTAGSSRDIPLRRNIVRNHNNNNARTNTRQLLGSSSSTNSQSTSSIRSQNQYRNNQAEKDYTIDDSYSQHVRVSVPRNGISTQVPKLQKPTSRSRGRTYQPSNAGHGRGRSHTSSSSSGHHDTNTDYYADESPVEIKVPRTKSHVPYIRNSYSGSNRVHQLQQKSRSQSSTSQPKELHGDASIEQELHVVSPSTYLRRRPYTENVHSRPTSKSHANEEQSDSSTSRHHHSQSSRQNLHHQQQRYQASIQDENYKSLQRPRDRSRSRALKFNVQSNEGVVVDAYELTSPTARPAYYISPQREPNSNEFVSADMDLKRLQPYHTSSRPVVSDKNNNSSDIHHSVSISISSRVSHAYDDEDGVHLLLPDHQDDEATSKSDNEAHETEDYDVYSPQYTNYVPTAAPTDKLVPIQFFHVKPTDVSSFQPAKSIIDEDDDDEIG